MGNLAVAPVTVNVMPLLVVPLTVTTTLPVVAPVGTRATILVVLQLVGVAAVPLNVTLLLATPPTVTTTLPVVAPVGTGAAILVALQLVGAAAVPLNVTVLDPCNAPKFVPVMVTEVPTAPEVGLRLAMLGAVVTVKATPLLPTPPTVTTTLPVVAPVGTGATMLVTLQLVGVAALPL